MIRHEKRNFSQGEFRHSVALIFRRGASHGGFLCALLLLFGMGLTRAQNADTLPVCEPVFRQVAAPLALMAYGVVETVLSPNVKSLNFAAHQAVETRKPRKIGADDYLQYVPMASVYALDIAGVKAKHNFRDRTIILGMAAVFMAASVNTLKYTVREQRPDGSRRNSFPSGHTATAFMGAEFLYQEYKDVSPWIGVAGYTVATATGLLRVHNNRHWVGDVFFGAGVGILSTKAAYWLYPQIQQSIRRHRRKKGRAEAKNASETVYLFAPYYNGTQGGLAASLHF